MHKPADEPGAESIRVLVCDDHDAIRALVRIVVELEEGMDVVGEATNGEIAIREARRLQPDVVLLDLSMPVMTGLDALPEIRRVAPDAAIVVFSGIAAENAGARALELGASCYLQKGVPSTVIVATIARVGARRIVTPGVGSG